MPVKPADERTAEDRARMRATERRYLETHPERLAAKRARWHERYREDPEFRQRVLDSQKRYRERKADKGAQPTIEIA